MRHRRTGTCVYATAEKGHLLDPAQLAIDSANEETGEPLKDFQPRRTIVLVERQDSDSD